MTRGLIVIVISVTHGIVLTHPDGRQSPSLTCATPSACIQLMSREKPHWTARDLHVHGGHGSTTTDGLVPPVLVVRCCDPGCGQQIPIGLGGKRPACLHVHGVVL